MYWSSIRSSLGTLLARTGLPSRKHLGTLMACFRAVVALEPVRRVLACRPVNVLEP